jgi:hypothetical protein
MPILTTAIFRHAYDPTTLDSLADHVTTAISTEVFYAQYLALLQSEELERASTAFRQSRHQPWHWYNDGGHVPRPLTAQHVSQIWQDEQDSLNLKGPCWIRLHVAPHAILYKELRWRVFLTDLPAQIMYRGLCAQIARALGSPAAIYLPDSAYPISCALDTVEVEGAPWEACCETLAATYGPPAPQLDVIAQRYDSNHYYIDTFSDFPETQAANPNISNS